MARFEKRKDSPINVILKALTHAKFPNVVDADLFMRMQYETAFGIHNHYGPDSKEVPFPLLAHSPKESLTTLDPLDFRLDQFSENQVNETFGLKFDDLITWCRADYLKVIAAAKKFAEKKGNLGNNELKRLEAVIAQQHAAGKRVAK